MERVRGLGLVPSGEVVDLPEAVEEDFQPFDGGGNYPQEARGP